MALVPPPNAAGIVAPANPQNPPTLSDITNSKEYVARLDHSKISRIPGAATDDEIGLAERYHHEVVLKNSLMGAVPPPWLAPVLDAAPPPWLAQFMNNVLAGINNVQADVNEIRADVNEIRADVNEIRADVRRLSAQQENGRIGRLNHQELLNNTGVTVYRTKQKIVAGDGTELANALLPPGFAPLAAIEEVPMLGAVISPLVNVHNLTHHDILRIIQFYSEDFRIQEGETVPFRRKKIENWLTMDV